MWSSLHSLPGHVPDRLVLHWGGHTQLHRGETGQLLKNADGRLQSQITTTVLCNSALFDKNLSCPTPSWEKRQYGGEFDGNKSTETFSTTDQIKQQNCKLEILTKDRICSQEKKKLGKWGHEIRTKNVKLDLVGSVLLFFFSFLFFFFIFEQSHSRQ